MAGGCRLLKLAGEEVEETEIPGFQSGERTLYCSNVCFDQILQVSDLNSHLMQVTVNINGGRLSKSYIGKHDLFIRESIFLNRSIGYTLAACS